MATIVDASRIGSGSHLGRFGRVQSHVGVGVCALEFVGFEPFAFFVLAEGEFSLALLSVEFVVGLPMGRRADFDRRTVVHVGRGRRGAVSRRRWPEREKHSGRRERSAGPSERRFSSGIIVSPVQKRLLIQPTV